MSYFHGIKSHSHLSHTAQLCFFISFLTQNFHSSEKKWEHISVHFQSSPPSSHKRPPPLLFSLIEAIKKNLSTRIHVHTSREELKLYCQETEEADVCLAVTNPQAISSPSLGKLIHIAMHFKTCTLYNPTGFWPDCQ